MTTHTYELTSARLLISTFGDEFDERHFQPLQLLAKNLDRAEDIQKCLDSCRRDFRSKPHTKVVEAMNEANEYTEKQLAATLGGTVVLITDKEAYQPISDNGEVVGHDTTGLLLFNGSPIRLAPVGGGGVPAVGGLAILFLATEQI